MVMKGDWLLVLALRDRANKESVETSVVEKEEEEQYGDLAIWLQHRFNGYFTVLVKKYFHSCFHLFYAPKCTVRQLVKECILLHSNFSNELLIGSQPLAVISVQC